MVEKNETIVKEPVIQLPEAKETERRLTTVETGINEFLSPLYTRISIFEKAELTGKQLIILLSYQIYNLLREEGRDPQSIGILLLYIPDYIDTLVDNKEFSKKTMGLYSRMFEDRHDLLIKALGNIYQTAHPNGVIPKHSSSLSFIPADEEIEGLWKGIES